MSKHFARGEGKRDDQDQIDRRGLEPDCRREGEPGDHEHRRPGGGERCDQCEADESCDEREPPAHRLSDPLPTLDDEAGRDGGDQDTGRRREPRVAAAPGQRSSGGYEAHDCSVDDLGRGRTATILRPP
jgi:hypothetical protein